MSYFISSENLLTGKTLEIGGEEARHLLLSRRLKVGENLKLQGPDEKRFLCEVLLVGKKTLKILVKEKVLVPKEPVVSINLYQAVVSQTALDLIFQKATELQADKIVLFNSYNTANALAPQKFKEKKIRWEKVLQEAAKQCDRVRPPQLLFLNNLNEVIDAMRALSMVVLLDPQSPKKFKDLKTSISKTLGLVVGPEGGFTQAETVQILALPGAEGVSLGGVLLRAETAAIAALALAQNI